MPGISRGAAVQKASAAAALRAKAQSRGTTDTSRIPKVTQMQKPIKAMPHVVTRKVGQSYTKARMKTRRPRIRSTRSNNLWW